MSYPFFKRLFDIVGSSLGLVLSSPLFLLSAILVKVSSRGPVLFGHRRCGKDGTTFSCLKFRTMVVDAERRLEEDEKLREQHRANGFKLPLRKDPRVTSVGRFLRVTHLDELPQLVNVLRGDMSLVGPRPIVEQELALFGDDAQALLTVQPGIFGAWTAQGKNRAAYPERARIEVSYVKDRSFSKDLKILARNLPVLARGQGEE
ncbi:MAG: sugar transferase [Gemmatimonadota bacterium]